MQLREIKFRGLDVMTGDWVYGSHLKAGTGLEYIIPQNIVAQDLPTYTVDPDTVGELTGLKDKNGKEIYEGDIVSCNYMDWKRFSAQVKFGEYEQDGSGGEYSGTTCIGFYAEAINKELLDEFDCRLTPEYMETTSLLSFVDIEIIGNIHEEPELLGEPS